MPRKHKNKLNPSAKKRASKAIEKAEKLENTKKIKKLAKQGLNRSRIAREIGRSVTYVYNICYEHKIETTNRHRVITDKEVAKVRTLATHNLVTEIYEKSGIPKDVVKSIMLEHNIKAKASMLGRKSEVRKQLEARDYAKYKSNKKPDVFDISKEVLSEKGYKSSADYISQHGYIAFQNNIKPLVYKRLNSTLETNNQ